MSSYIHYECGSDECKGRGFVVERQPVIRETVQCPNCGHLSGKLAQGPFTGRRSRLTYAGAAPSINRQQRRAAERAARRMR